MTAKVCFRAEAGPEIGLGHLSRCLSLFDHLRGAFEIKFILNNTTRSILGKIAPEINESAIAVFDRDRDETEQTKEICGKGDILVLDGYRFTPDDVRSFQSAGIIVVFIDDLICKNLGADVIINHCGGIAPAEFETDPLTVFCLGPEFAMLRPSFLVRPDTTPVYDILIGFGGADPLDFTRQTLSKLPDGNIVAVLAGPAYAHVVELEELAKTRTGMTLFRNLDPESLAKVMAESKNAILSASVISYEFLAVSHGSLYVIQTANNQARMFQFLTSSGIARSFEGTIDKNFRSRQIVDGNSAKRLRAVFQSIAIERSAKVRRAGAEDMMTVFEWVNDPDVRRQSYHSAPIEREVHERWFMATLKDAKVCYYLVEHAGKLVGQIRFNVEKDIAIINYLVDPDHRGQGWGDRVLRLGMRQLRIDQPGVRIINGFVKQDNHASFNSFIKCNFVESATNEYPESVLFTLNIQK
jgi:spore coat polysaccharide biosynthesis predicted glycosyltransferase SpsG/ribosomal protein S18 acetylase RimI-like enzyme